MPMPETERQRTERVLRGLLAEAQAAEAEVEESRKFLLSGLFSKKEDRPAKSAAPARSRKPAGHDWPQPPAAQFPKPMVKAGRRSDMIVAGMGIALGLICALFPWYIFYNDVRFSTHGFKLGGSGEHKGRIVSADPRAGAALPLSAQDDTAPDLDLFPTGTPAAEQEEASEAPGIDQQPFPAANTDFQLVHVANGRAMIEDDTGLWIVQPGSMLPDKSKVSAIEMRGGKWVLVTSANKVIQVAR